MMKERKQENIELLNQILKMPWSDKDNSVGLYCLAKIVKEMLTHEDEK